MSGHPFKLSGIIWAEPADLPSEVILNVPQSLLDISPEMFEPGYDEDDYDDDDDDDDDDDAVDYDESGLVNDAPSDEAIDLFEAEWDRTLRDILTEQFGIGVVSISSFEPYWEDKESPPWEEDGTNDRQA